MRPPWLEGPKSWESRKIEARGTEVFFTPFAYKASHIVLKEESARPSLRQDSLWQGESDCEQLTDSTETARDSLGTFDGLK